MFKNSEFRRFCNESTALREKKNNNFSDFASATRDLTPNFIKFKNPIQYTEAYDTTTNESQEVSPFPAGDHKAFINRRARKHNKKKTD